MLNRIAVLHFISHVLQGLHFKKNLFLVLGWVLYLNSENRYILALTKGIKILSLAYHLFDNDHKIRLHKISVKSFFCYYFSSRCSDNCFLVGVYILRTLMKI